MRAAALDLGDAWIGVALSDPLRITARPFTTIKAKELIPFLEKTIGQQAISTIVVGHPQTLRGTASAQTIKIETQFEQLQEQFPAVTWVLWDERLTSKQASRIKRAKTKEDTLQQHAVAAALILQTYLEHVALQQS